MQTTNMQESQLTYIHSFFLLQELRKRCPNILFTDITPEIAYQRGLEENPLHPMIEAAKIMKVASNKGLKEIHEELIKVKEAIEHKNTEAKP